MPIRFHSVASLAALLVTASLLASCGSSRITMKKGSLTAEQDVPFERYIETLPLKGGELAVLRDLDDEEVVLEKYSDTLGQLWSIKPKFSGAYTLMGGFSFDDDLQRKRIRHSLCFDGTHLGMLYQEDVPGSDDRRTMLRTFDPADGKELRTLALDTFPENGGHAHVRGGGYLVSPDQKQIAAYSFDYDDMIEKEHGKQIRVVVKLFSSSGEPRRVVSGTIPMEGDFHDVDDALEVMEDPFLDSRGRFYQPVARGDRSLEVVRIDPNDGTTRSFHAFGGLMPKDDDIGIGWVRFREAPNNALVVGIGTRDDDELMGVGYARFDGTAEKPAAQWYHAIDEKEAESLVDDDLDYFRLDGMEIGADGGVVFTLEYQEFLAEVDRKYMITNYIYQNRDIVTLVFAPDGRVRRAVAFAKDMKWAGWGASLSQILNDDGSALLMLYPDDDRGMHLASIPIGESGSVADGLLAQMGNNGVLMHEIAWDGQGAIVIPTLGVFSNRRLVKMRLP